MAYGCQIFTNDGAIDLVETLAPAYVMGTVYVNNNSGSASYSVPSGMTLKYMFAPETFVQPNVNINGNSASWNGGLGRIIFYCE